MKTYTLTSHVADQVAALETAGVRRRRVIRPIMLLVAIGMVCLAGYFVLADQIDRAVITLGVGVIAQIVLGAIAIAGPNERDVAIKRAGAAGEAVLPQLLRSLPDSYTLLNGVPVPGGRADIDHVLVGPTGVWAIEAKHHVGMVQCVGDAWGYARLGPGGVPRQGHIGNPSQQAHRAADALKRYLRHRNLNVNVQPVVVFTHPQVELDLEQATLTILRAAEVERFVLRQPHRVSDQMSERIVHTIRSITSR